MINNIWILIGKKLNNEASVSELEELERLLSKDNTGNYPMELIEMLWSMREDTAVEDLGKEMEENWNKVSLMLNSRSEEADMQLPEIKQISSNRNKIQRYLLAFAACLVLTFISVGVVKNFSFKKQNNNSIKITSANGTIRKISLPDGSTVALNSGSSITYQKTFDGKHRELFLSGEALFDITKDPKHPFVVHTQAMNIRVLGTKFNVKAYPDDNTAEASLFRGSIELTVVNDPQRHILLKPSEKIKIIKAPEPAKNPKAITKAPELPVIKLIELGQITQKLKDTVPEEIMWLSHRLVFDAEEFGEVAKQMERKYNVSILFQNADAEKFKFTGRFDDITLDQALEQLQIISKFNYTIKGKMVTIY